LALHGAPPVLFYGSGAIFLPAVAHGKQGLVGRFAVAIS
jgi:hypothetical protein